MGTVLAVVESLRSLPWARQFFAMRNLEAERARALRCSVAAEFAVSRGLQSDLDLARSLD